MTEEAKLFVIRALRPPIYGETVHDLGERLREAAKLIESLSAELEHVKRERDAAVETMAENPRCETCKHYTPGYFCLGCKRGDKWQWRGVKEE